MGDTNPGPPTSPQLRRLFVPLLTLPAGEDISCALRLLSGRAGPFPWAQRLLWARFDWITSHVFRNAAVTILDKAKLSSREISGPTGHAKVSTMMNLYMGQWPQGRGPADAPDAAMGSESK